MNNYSSNSYPFLIKKKLSAFRKGHSCQILLVKYIEDWKAALDQNKHIGVLFTDLSKAFDCLPHTLLLAKLRAYGLDISASNLIASNLSNRNQRVKTGNARSEWIFLSKGVPQGSILGPLLFNVFINDMFLFINKCTLYNYADDNSLSCAATTVQEVISSLQFDGSRVIQWFTDNGMRWWLCSKTCTEWQYRSCFRKTRSSAGGNYWFQAKFFPYISVLSVQKPLASWMHWPEYRII